MECQNDSQSNLLVQASYSNSDKRKITVRASIVDTDIMPFVHRPLPSFDDMTTVEIMGMLLSLFPIILEIDKADGGEKIRQAINDLAEQLDALAGTGTIWTSLTDVPDIAVDAMFYLDAVLDLIRHTLDITFAAPANDAPDELPDDFFGTGTTINHTTGKLFQENIENTGWEPAYIKYSGKVNMGKSKITVAEAKAEFSHYTANRHWNDREKQMIPHMPDAMPVMPEVLRFAKRILQTRTEPIPAKNMMWRGETGIGKSTGMRQLACILNIPFVTLVCFPSMEAQDFRSTLVPESSANVEIGREPATSFTEAESDVSDPKLKKALTHLSSLPSGERNTFLGDKAAFFSNALLDQDDAESSLFGEVVNLDLTDTLSIYAKCGEILLKQAYEEKISSMASGSDAEISTDNSPKFIHVLSPYMEALINGYMVEIQEASRIRDPGVLVSLNDYELPGARIQLMDGSVAYRHPDALCFVTDNVGYAGCRSLEQSFIRRQSMIIDSVAPTKDYLLSRVKQNTGVTDITLLDHAYKLWSTVRDFCEQNAITEGSVSPVELERFVQALKFDGEDSIAENLDDCIISKASSSIDDQRDIRTVCQTLLGTI